MLQANAGKFVAAIDTVATVRQMILFLSEKSGQYPIITRHTFHEFRSAVSELKDICCRFDLNSAALSAERALSNLDIADQRSASADLVHIAEDLTYLLNANLLELSSRIRDGPAERLMLNISMSKLRYYQPQLPIFDTEVVDKFPNCLLDMFEAGNCFALGRNTACVFHLMRVMEAGVQAFGAKLGVTLADTLNWQNILNELNPIIKAMDHKLSHTKKLASIQSNLYNVKVAWRNEVMHPKATYDEMEAQNIFNAVRAFMSDLAPIL